MAVSKDDIQRAKCIMESIITEVSDSLDAGEEEMGSLLAVQNVLDILKSPLFATVVDIRDQCKKHVQNSERWNEAADVKAMDTADVVAQFKERYKITSDKDVANARTSSTANTLPERLLDDTSVSTSPDSPQHLPLLSHHLSEEYGSTLNKQHQRTPSVSSTDSRSSAGSRKKRGKRGGKGVTLGQLARDPAQTGEIPLKTVPAKTLSSGRNSEVSLSSLSSDANAPPPPPSSPPDIFSSTPSSTTATTAPDKEEGCERDHPKDVLFFMRDKKSMTDVRAALNGKWGRGQREVVLSLNQYDSIGMELCGISTTGVFVLHITEPKLKDILQVGDEILTVDGCSICNMPWFEVQHLLQSSDMTSSKMGHPKSLEMVEKNSHILTVQYNPTGVSEIKRQEDKIRN